MQETDRKTGSEENASKYPPRLAIVFDQKRNGDMCHLSVTTALTNLSTWDFYFPFDLDCAKADREDEDEDEKGTNEEIDYALHLPLYNLAQEILAADGVVHLQADRYIITVFKAPAFHWKEILDPIVQSTCLHIYGLPKESVEITVQYKK